MYLSMYTDMQGSHLCVTCMCFRGGRTTNNLERPEVNKYVWPGTVSQDAMGVTHPHEAHPGAMHVQHPEQPREIQHHRGVLVLTRRVVHLCNAHHTHNNL